MTAPDISARERMAICNSRTVSDIMPGPILEKPNPTKTIVVAESRVATRNEMPLL
jgi:hypothetical protein